MSRRAFTLTKRMRRDPDAAKRERQRRAHRHELRMARGIEVVAFIGDRKWHVVELSLDGPVVRDNRDRLRARHA